MVPAVFAMRTGRMRGRSLAAVGCNLRRRFGAVNAAGGAVGAGFVQGAAGSRCVRLGVAPMLHGFGGVDAQGVRGGGCGRSAEERQTQHRQEGGGAGQRSCARAVFSLVEPALRLDYHKNL